MNSGVSVILPFLFCETLYYPSHGLIYPLICFCFDASLATTRFQVSELDAKLKASNQALEEAQAKIADLKAKQQKEIKAAVKSVEKVVAQENADTSKAEDQFAKKDAN
jgi:hypothetical protein